MENTKFKIGDKIIYRGARNDWTYSSAINPNDTGIIQNNENGVLMVKFDNTDIIAPIDIEDIVLIQSL